MVQASMSVSMSPDVRSPEDKNQDFAKFMESVKTASINQE